MQDTETDSQKVCERYGLRHSGGIKIYGLGQKVCERNGLRKSEDMQKIQAQIVRRYVEYIDSDSQKVC